MILTCHAFFSLEDYGLFQCEDLLFGFLVITVGTILNTSKNPWHKAWVIPGPLTKILADFDTGLLLLSTQEYPNAHISVPTKTCVTKVLKMIKWRILEHLLMRGIACTCYKHVTAQWFVYAQQEQSQKFMNTPCISTTADQITRFELWIFMVLERGFLMWLPALSIRDFIKQIRKVGVQ